MNWKHLLNVVVTAVVSGAVAGVAQHYGGSGTGSVGSLAGSAIAGAAVSVVNQLRSSPLDAPKG